MMATAGTAFGVVAILAMAIEWPKAAAAFGVVAYWLIAHGFKAFNDQLRFDCPPRAIHAAILKAGLVSSTRAAASRTSASRPR